MPQKGSVEYVIGPLVFGFIFVGVSIGFVKFTGLLSQSTSPGGLQAAELLTGSFVFLAVLCFGLAGYRAFKRNSSRDSLQ